MKRIKIPLLCSLLILVRCGSSPPPPSENEENSGQADGVLSKSFTTVGCSAGSCHGLDGKRANTKLHDESGYAITNLSTSKRSLKSWTAWIRTDAKNPMPTFTPSEYPDTDLKSDYIALTGRSE